MPKILSILLLIIALCVNAGATNRYVSKAGNDSNDGLSWGTAKLTFSNATATCVSNDILWMGDGVYTNISDSYSCFEVAPFTTLAGTNSLILSGNRQANSSVVGLSTNCVLSNATVTLGSGGTYGGGVTFWRTGGKIFNCTITNNITSANGGGVFAYQQAGGTNGIIRDSTIISNYSGGLGGGLYFVNYASNCLVKLNKSAGSGGGAYSSTLIDCRIIQNSSSDFGGGLRYCDNTRGTVVSNSTSTTAAGAQDGVNTDCLFEYNRAGIYYGAGQQSTFYSCILQYNFASNILGAVGQSPSYNCLIVSNSCGQTGSGGSYNSDMNNSIVYGNVGVGQSGYAANNFYGGSIPAGIWTNPVVFLPDSYKLPEGSPLIDVGNDTYAIGLDFYGRARIYGLHVDYGPSEWSPNDIPSSGETSGKKTAFLKWLAKAGK